MLLVHATLVLPDRLLPDGWVHFSDEGRILAWGRGAFPHDPVTIDMQGNFLSPGFIDLHLHGALGHDAMQATGEAFAAIATYHASGGTTSLALTTIAAPLPDLLAVLQTAQNFPNTHAGARLLGIHLEGPWFSLAKPGAHSPALLHPPTDLAEIEQLLAFSDSITQVTLAPELPGSLSLIERLVALGIIVSGGHSDAWADEAEAAFVHGLSQVTHTFNCMSSARRRGPFREAGLLEFALAEPGLGCELIADGRHVSPTLMKMLYRAKGADGIQLITDATAGAGLAEGETFRLGELHGVVRDGVGMLADGSALAGSTCRMIDGIRHLVSLVGLPLFEAVRTATLNPARALGHSADLGSFEPGSRADFALFSADFQILQTWVGGRIVFQSRPH